MGPRPCATTADCEPAGGGIIGGADERVLRKPRVPAGTKGSRQARLRVPQPVRPRAGGGGPHRRLRPLGSANPAPLLRAARGRGGTAHPLHRWTRGRHGGHHRQRGGVLPRRSAPLRARHSRLRVLRRIAVDQHVGERAELRGSPRGGPSAAPRGPRTLTRRPCRHTLPPASRVAHLPEAASWRGALQPPATVAVRGGRRSVSREGTEHLRVPAHRGGTAHQVRGSRLHRSVGGASGRHRSLPAPRVVAHCPAWRGGDGATRDAGRGQGAGSRQDYRNASGTRPMRARATSASKPARPV
jgi:hypothetical protein